MSDDFQRLAGVFAALILVALVSCEDEPELSPLLGTGGQESIVQVQPAPAVGQPLPVRYESSLQPTSVTTGMGAGDRVPRGGPGEYRPPTLLASPPVLHQAAASAAAEVVPKIH